MASKEPTIFEDQSGTALVVALIMMVVITLIALASSYTSIFEMKISGNKRGATNAFYGAETCINCIQPYATNFDTIHYTLVAGTTTTYNNPFSDGSIPNPANIAPTDSKIIYFQNQSGPPRGGGYGQSVSYAYYQIQCTGRDTAGSAASSVIREDVMRIIPNQ